MTCDYSTYRLLRNMTGDYVTWLAITLHWWAIYAAWQAKKKVLQDLWTMNNIWLKDSRCKSYKNVWLFVLPNKQFAFLNVYFSKAVRSLNPSLQFSLPFVQFRSEKRKINDNMYPVNLNTITKGSCVIPYTTLANTQFIYSDKPHK